MTLNRTKTQQNDSQYILQNNILKGNNLLSNIDQNDILHDEIVLKLE
jgi:hypothetical protein